MAGPSAKRWLAMTGVENYEFGESDFAELFMHHYREVM